MTQIEPVRTFIRRQFLYDQDTPLAEDDVLFPDLVDSLGIMTVIEFVEEHYGIVIDDDDLTAANVSTLASLAVLIDRKLAEERAE